MYIYIYIYIFPKYFPCMFLCVFVNLWSQQKKNLAFREVVFSHIKIAPFIRLNRSLIHTKFAHTVQPASGIHRQASG